MTEANIKRWTSIIVGVIGVLTAAHAIPLLNYDGSGAPEWANEVHAILVVSKAVMVGAIAVINAITQESN